MDTAIKEYYPSMRLGPYVELFWFGQFNLNQTSLLSQRVIPNGYIELIIHLTDSHCELTARSGLCIITEFHIDRSFYTTLRRPFPGKGPCIWYPLQTRGVLSRFQGCPLPKFLPHSRTWKVLPEGISASTPAGSVIPTMLGKC